jgi:UDP-GlcNAc:undecaprenyl-phosphate GlcNAc-1-phosphate transferase
MNTFMSTHILVLCVTCVISLCLTPLVRTAALKAGVLDVPDGRRKRHAQPIPKLGGVAIFVSFYVCLWLALAFGGSDYAASVSRLVSALFLPSLVILALGVADDIHPTGPWVKIGVQLVAGMLIYYPFDPGSNDIPLLTSSFGVLGFPATLLWIVLVTNAFNIVDGIDGLAAGVAFIALIVLSLMAVVTHNLAVAAVAAPLAGAVLGFLRYNFNPASVFLGDSGSLLLGFKLAVLSLVASTNGPTALAPVAALLVLALPLTEAATSIVRRYVAGRSILQPDIHHIHHQLIRRGFQPRRATVVLYAWAAVFGIASLFAVRSGVAGVVLVALTCVGLTWLGIQQLGYVEFAEINNTIARLRRNMQDNITSRKLADDLSVVSSVGDAWLLLQGAAKELGFSYVELRGGHNAVRYAQQLRSSRRRAAGETNFTVSLYGRKELLGEVTFRRPVNARPLHSLPLVIGEVCNRLSDVLERCAVEGEAKPLGSPLKNYEHQDFAPVRRQRPQAAACGSCGSQDLHRTRTWSIAERLRKHMTSKRPHTCASCGWRGWIVPPAMTSVASAASPGTRAPQTVNQPAASLRRPA